MNAIVEPSAPPFVELVDIVKKYDDVKANDGVNLKIRSGEIHALLGENGAGKSTLVKIIYGFARQDSGSILIDGVETRITSPAKARKLGIGMVFQHFSLFESLTVAENIALVLPSGRNHLKRISREIEAVSAKYRLNIRPGKALVDLTMGERQRVEIIRCLLQDPRLLIMDEPTSVITPGESRELFVTLKALAKEGRAVLYISHKLEEIRELCARATIIRAGKTIAERIPGKESRRSLAELMIGGKLERIVKKKPEKARKVVFTVKNLSHDPGNPLEERLHDVCFDLREGEILGIAGIAGNGQTRLCSLLSGETLSANADAIRLHDRPIGRKRITHRRRMGISFIPEERLGRGAIASMSLKDNCLLGDRHGDRREKKFSKLGWIRSRNVLSESDKIVERFNVRASGSQAEAGSLSGGNLQKFIVGREIGSRPEVLITASPTWGIDGGAGVFVRQALLDLAKEGTSILLVSQDLDEIFELGDRIAVISEGRLSRVYLAREIGVEDIGLMMGGSPLESERLPETVPC